MSDDYPEWYKAALTRQEPEYDPDKDLRNPPRGLRIRSESATAEAQNVQRRHWGRYILWAVIWIPTFPVSLLVWPIWPWVRRWYLSRLKVSGV